MDDGTGLRCHGDWQSVIIDVIRGPSVKSLMSSHLVIELEVAREPRAQRRNRVVGFQINVFVFDTAPQPFDEDVFKYANDLLFGESFALHPGTCQRSIYREIPRCA